MKRHTIYQFMWGYQSHFRVMLEILAKDVLAKLGAAPKVQVLLVGARRPSHEHVNDVCVEPQDGEWPSELFAQLLLDV